MAPKAALVGPNTVNVPVVALNVGTRLASWRRDARVVRPADTAV